MLPKFAARKAQMQHIAACLNDRYARARWSWTSRTAIIICWRKFSPTSIWSRRPQGHPRGGPARGIHHPQRVREGLTMIRLLVLDVDGTMTDARYYDATGNELKKFAIKDGAGLVLARTAASV